MQALDIVDKLRDKKGQHVQAFWQRVAQVKKDCPFVVIKRTSAWVRSGIAYANLQDVRQGIEAGTREPIQSLPWGKWRKGFVNYIIDHNDKEYIRLYPASFGNLEPKTEWLMNGKPVDYSTVEPYLLASEKRKEENRLCFTIDAANIIDIAD